MGDDRAARLSESTDRTARRGPVQKPGYLPEGEYGACDSLFAVGVEIGLVYARVVWIGNDQSKLELKLTKFAPR